MRGRFLREFQYGARLAWPMPVLGLTGWFALHAKPEGSQPEVDNAVGGTPTRRKLLQTSGLPQPTDRLDVSFGKLRPSSGG